MIAQDLNPSKTAGEEMTEQRRYSFEQSRNGRKIIYLACPYTHTDHMVRELRFRAATEAAAALIREGAIVYSPITMTHPIDVVLAEKFETLGSDYWVTFDEAFMDMCSEIVVLTIDGWRDSSGVKREVKYFERKGLQIKYMEPVAGTTKLASNSDSKLAKIQCCQAKQKCN